MFLFLGLLVQPPPPYNQVYKLQNIFPEMKNVKQKISSVQV